MSAIAMVFMPESPLYLVTKNKDDDALKALIWLRGTENVKNELEGLKKSCKDQMSIGSVSYLNIFKNRLYLEPLLIMISIMFLQQFSGTIVILFYLKVVYYKVFQTTF
jgi:hypothetical protein